MPPGRSLRDLEDFGRRLSEKLGIGDLLSPFTFALLVPRIESRCDVKVVVVEDGSLGEADAQAIFGEKTIKLTKSTFEAGVSGCSRALMTLIHELLHIEFCHEGQNNRDARGHDQLIGTIQRYEWEVKRGAPYVLMPTDRIRYCETASAIQKICNVNSRAADIRLKQLDALRRRANAALRDLTVDVHSYLLNKKNAGYTVFAIKEEDVWAGQTMRGQPVLKRKGGSYKAICVETSTRVRFYAELLRVVQRRVDENVRKIDNYLSGLPTNPLRRVSDGLTEASIDRYIQIIERENRIHFARAGAVDPAIAELTKFGIATIGDLHSMISPSILQHYSVSPLVPTLVGFLRTILLYADPIKYLARQFPWNFIDHGDFELLAGKYGRESLDEMLSFSGIIVLADIEKAQPLKSQN